MLNCTFRQSFIYAYAKGNGAEVVYVVMVKVWFHTVYFSGIPVLFLVTELDFKELQFSWVL